MEWLRRACEWGAAAAVAAATVIAGGTAVSRYALAHTPTWAEPVMVLLVLLAVALAVGPGLQDGAHVAIRVVADRLETRARRLVARLVDATTLLLGVAICVSGAAYAQDQFVMGFTDFAGIPQWIQAALASVFGALLAAFALDSLIRPGRRRPDPTPEA